MSIPNPLDTLTSGLASIACLPFGVTVKSDIKRPPEEPKLLQLYDIENSRTCQKVRAQITELDLVVEKVIPASENSRVFQDKSYEYFLPETADIPRLLVEEPSGETRWFAGDDIISYLDECYGTTAPTKLEERDIKQVALETLHTVGGYAATLLRFGRGLSVTSAASGAPQKKPLILYSYEGNQFCRLVREVLTELDLVYELKSCGKESPRRQELADITGGSSQCPFLIDPNTNTQMAESADIVKYLYKTYALWTPPNELLQLVSNSLLPLFKPLFSALTPIQAGSRREVHSEYEVEISNAKKAINKEVSQAPVVVYTYDLSPFSSETKELLDNLDIPYTDISLGKEWFPFLIAEGGSAKRAALLEMTGQSSLPHVFIGGKSIGGLFDGNPGLVPALEQGLLLGMIDEAKNTKEVAAASGEFE